MKYLSFILSIFLTMLIVFISLALVVIIISKFSVAEFDKLIYEFEEISNYSGAVLTIFSLGFITACIEDISKFIDKKLKKYNIHYKSMF